MSQSNSDIALFLSSLDGGGAHKMMIQIAKGLSKSGYNVDLVVIKERGPLIDMVPQEVDLVTLKSGRALTSWLSLIKYLDINEPKAMLATPVTTTLPAVWAKILSPVDFKLVLRIPVVLSQTQFHTNPHGNKDRLLPHLIKLFYPHADEYIAISQGVADDLKTTFGISSRNINTIYNPAVDDHVMTQKNDDVEHRFFEEPYPVLLGVGRLTEQKDFTTLIETFDKLTDDIDARLIILGEGEKRNELTSLIQSKGLSNKVSMPGYVKNPFPYMKQADVFVLSSAWEGFGNVIPEALACGTPVVSTDCKSGPREILDHGKYGELVDVGDSEALAKSINKALTKDADENRLIERSMEYHIDNIVPKYESVLVE